MVGIITTLSKVFTLLLKVTNEGDRYESGLDRERAVRGGCGCGSDSDVQEVKRYGFSE